MSQRRYTSQKKGIDEQWTELCGKMEEEVLEKYQEFAEEKSKNKEVTR